MGYRKPLPADIKVGDELTISTGWRGIPSIRKVTRVTDASVFCGGTRVRRYDSKIIGRDYEYAAPTTDADRAREERTRLVNRVTSFFRGCSYESLTTEALTKIARIIHDPESQEPTR